MKCMFTGPCRLGINIFLLSILIFVNHAASAATQLLPSRMVILQYHHVGNSTATTTTITNQHFSQHLELIQQLGAEVVDIATGLTRIQQTPKELFLVAITFDDASDTLLPYAIPELQRRNWPFTLFVNTLAVEQQHDRTLSWQQLRQLQQQEVIIANHSHRHQHLIEQDDWWQDVTLAQQLLQKHVYPGQAAPHLLSFPYGEYNFEIEQRLQQQQWIGVGQHSGAVGLNSPQESLPRFAVSGIYANPKSLKEKLLSLPFPATSHSQSKIFTQGRMELTWQLDGRETLPFSPSQLMCYHSETGQHKPIFNQQQLSLLVSRPFSSRRGKINCTAPHSMFPRHYFWMSQLFINTRCEELGCNPR